jgi:hypothetical protein
MPACLRPVGIGHLEDPEQQSRVALALRAARFGPGEFVSGHQRKVAGARRWPGGGCAGRQHQPGGGARAVVDLVGDWLSTDHIALPRLCLLGAIRSNGHCTCATSDWSLTRLAPGLPGSNRSRPINSINPAASTTQSRLIGGVSCCFST